MNVRVVIPGRKGYVPGARHRNYMRDVVVMKESLSSSPAKKPRPEPYEYHDERRQFPKPAFKTPDPRAVNPGKVIEKKPVLNAAAIEEWRALPQRTTAPRRKTVHIPEPKTTDVTTATPVAKPVEQKPKVVPPTKEVKEVKEVLVKEAKVVKEAPAVKAKVVEEVAKDAEVEKKDPAVKDAPVAKAAPEVKETDKGGKKATETKPTPTVAPNADGLYGLDDVTASVLHEELALIMIKVWQELPDSPPTDAEELVADRFRNAAGDDLRNALGLSVTSRLLNIHNPLYVKLHFSGKPEAGCLQAFIREYKIGAFKRIADKYRDTFAARFEDISDFDRLCAHSEVKCGSATVTIIPCYKYLCCPPSIKTIYAVNTDKTKRAANESTNSSPLKSSDKTQKSAQSAVKRNKTKAIDKENKIETKNSETNKTATPVINSKTAVDAKANTQEKAPEKSSESNKTPKKDESKTQADQKASDKSKVKSDFNDEMMVVDEMGDEDDEEMTDQDILALMSGGIVLDECSGSDDEK